MPSCRTDYLEDTAVTLNAMPGSDMVFAGWSGACSGASPECTVEMDGDKAVSAAFAAPDVTVVKQGAGTGIVSSDPPGIDCGPTCTYQFPAGTPVALTATPSEDSSVCGLARRLHGCGSVLAEHGWHQARDSDV